MLFRKFSENAQTGKFYYQHVLAKAYLKLFDPFCLNSSLHDKHVPM